MAVSAGAGALPTGVVLANDETAVQTERFIRSNLLPFLKLQLVVTNKRVAGQKATTFLGIIPVGSEKVSYPLANIASSRELDLPLSEPLAFFTISPKSAARKSGSCVASMSTVPASRATSASGAKVLSAETRRSGTA